MKRGNYMGLLMALTVAGQGVGQEQLLVRQKEVPTQELELSRNKTSNLIFPYGIVSVDRGDQGILAQRAKGADNVLQLKAAHAELKRSNVTVITSDRQLYTFNVRYAAHPKRLHFTMAPIERLDIKGERYTAAPTQPSLETKASLMLASLETSLRLKRRKMGMHIELDGLFVDGGRIFFRIHLINKSNLGYQIGQFRILLQDKKQVKRTAIQEKELAPQWLSGNLDAVPPRSKKSLLFMVPQFTIPDKKQLILQLMEANGARNFSLKMKNTHLQKGTPIY